MPRGFYYLVFCACIRLYSHRLCRGEMLRIAWRSCNRLSAPEGSQLFRHRVLQLVDNADGRFPGLKQCTTYVLHLALP